MTARAGLSGPQRPRAVTGQPDTVPLLPAATGPPEARAEPILAIDGTGLLVRCSRAARHAGLHGPAGEPTGALMMFISSLSRKIRLVQPSHVVVAWDGPDATLWRRGQWLPYKAGTPDVHRLGGELDNAMEFCGAAGIYQLCFHGFEADDVLAAISRAAMNMPEHPLLIASDDQDLHQLADEYPHHSVVITGLTKDHLITEDDVRQQWGTSGWALPRLRALAGDASDNIPGLPGVGPAKALKMMTRAHWSWPPCEVVIKDPEQRRLAVIWRNVMDLVIPVRPLEETTGAEMFRPFRELSRWDPDSGQNALELLDRYGMTQIAQLLRKGGLWKPAEGA
jgi:hypothetical protein